ncbi:hypothetical protein G9C98_006520 [Cotesia typhae]|uniref:Titin n=1 Tax=Cotesia typhae TaxID=2053667 RepID=A0A8J5V8U8_9HYME|nr:hypothetical protein G9C98_006520 [Cotesia typhae]
MDKYEDTQLVHETLHKEIQPEEHGSRVVEDTQEQDREVVDVEEESVVIERDEDRLVVKKPKKDTRKKREEEEKVVVVEEEEIVTKRIRKPTGKQKVEVEIEEIVEEEEEEEKRKKVIKAKRPQKGEEEIDFEEAEDFETIRDRAVPSVPVNTSVQSHEIVPLRRTAEQAPGKPESETARVTLDTVNALVEQYVPVQESEDKISKIKPDEKKALVSIAPVEPYSTTEITVQGSHGEFKGIFKPTTFEATPGVVTKPKESLQVTETLASDAKITGLDLKQALTIQKADVALTLQEATTVSETTVNQGEVPSQDFVAPAAVTAEDIMLPNISLSVYEVNEAVTEDKLEQSKTISAKPRVNISAVEPLTVEEVQTEDKPGKYYPELIVPTEMATTTVVAQKLFITEEMHAPEKEGEYVPGRLPIGQKAQVGVSEGGEAPMIGEQPIQEMEGVFVPGKKVDTVEAETNVNVLESFTVSTVETQHQEVNLVVEETKKAVADFNVVETSSVFTTETVTSEKEVEYKPEERPTVKTADSSILPLEIGSVSSTIVQESEGVYNEQVKPTSAIAETSLRPEEHVMVSQVETADLPSKFSEDLKYVTESGTVSVQLTEAKVVQETFTHDREEKFDYSAKPEEKIVDLIYDSVKGIEVFQTTSVDKEGHLEIYEMPESHRGKVVPTHSIMSLQIEETQPEDNVQKLDKLVPVTGKAKVGHDNLVETVVDITVVDEGLKPVEKDKVPESKFAEIGLNEVESVKTTEIIVNETEEDYRSVSKMESVFATTGFTTQSAVELQEVRTESPTGELPEEVRVSGMAQTSAVPLESVSVALHEVAEKEDVYTADIKPETKTASIDYTETRSGASVLEVLTHDLENEYQPGEKPRDFMASSSIDSRTIAMKSEVLIEQSAGKMSDDKPKTAKAFETQEAIDELVVVETNVAEAEKPRLEEAKPIEQNAQLDITTSENVSVMEITTAHAEETLQTEELVSEKTITMKLTSTHEVAQTEETVVANNIDDLSEVRPKTESATLHQSGLEIVQQIELTVSEKESILPEDVKPSLKNVDISFTEGESVQVQMTHSEHKEGQLADRVKPKSFEASIDFEVQGVASQYEVMSDTGFGELKTEVPQDARPSASLLPYETAVAEEVQTRETEAPLKEIQPDNRVAEMSFEIGESVIVSTVETGDKERPLEEIEKPENKLATFDFEMHPVAEASETITQDGTGEFTVEKTQPATALMDHITHKSIVMLETSVGDREGNIDNFVRPEGKVVDVAFEEAKISLSVTETISSDKEREYVSNEDIATEKATFNFDAHRVAELTEVTASSITDELKEKAPTSAVAKEEQLPFEGVIQTEAVVSEKEREFLEKPVIATNKAEMIIGDQGNVTTVSEVIIVDKEGSLKIPKKPEERRASIDITGHPIAEKIEVTVDSSAGVLEKLQKVSASATPSQTPLESVTRIETQPSESEGLLTKDLKPTKALADLSVVEDQSIQVTMVTIEDKESSYTPKDLPETKIADKALVGGHLVAETTEHVVDFSTEIITEEKTELSTAVLDQIPFNPLTSSQMIVGETEDHFVPDVKPEDHTAKVDVEFGRSTVTISQVLTGDKETTYTPEVFPSERAASMNINSTHEIAETTSTDVQDALGDIERMKLDSVKAITSQEVFRSLQVSQEIPQDKEQFFEGKFKANVKDVEVFIEEGKGVTTITEITTQAKEGTLDDLVRPEAREAVPTITSGHEVAEQTEVVADLLVGQVEALQTTSATARIGQKPYETVQLIEEFLGERESDHFEVKTVTSSAKVAVDEQSSVIVATTMTQDDEQELLVPKKPKEEMAKPGVEGKEVALQSEVVPKEGVDDLLVTKPTEAVAKSTQGTFESVNVIEAMPEELGSDFTGKFKPDQRSAAVSFVEGKSVTINEVMIQDKEGAVTVVKHIEGVAEVKLTRVGQDVAQKTEIIVDQSVGSIASFKSDSRKAHPTQDTLESVIIEEVPTGETEGNFVDYPKAISNKITPTFEEGHSVSITEVTSGEREKVFEEQKLLESRTAETTVIAQHGSILTTVVDSRVDVKTEVSVDERTPQTATPSQDTFESVTVSENIIEETEKTFEGKFKPATQTANIDVQEVKSVQVSETMSEFKEESFEGTPKIHTVQAKPEFSVLETVQKSQVETIHSIGEVKDETTVSSQATMTQTTMESVIKTETMTSERESTFEGKFKPDEHKGVAQMEGLSTVTVTEILSNEIEDTLTIDQQPKDRRALPNITGREVAETMEVETIVGPEEFDKFKGPEGVKGRPQVDTLMSVIVSQTVSNETEEFLPGLEVPSQKSIQANLDTREIAEVSEVETILTVGDFVKAVSPEEKKGKPEIEEFAPLTVSQVLSHEAEVEMPSPEKPSKQIAQPSLLGREIAETSQVETLLSAQKFTEESAPEERKVTFGLEEMTSLIVSQTISEEVEKILPGEEKPSTKKVQFDIVGHDVAETSQVLTFASFNQFEEKKPGEQKGKPGLEEHSSVTVSQVISNEAEENLASAEVPSTRTAQSNLSGREIAETSEVETLMNAENLAKDSAPKEEQGKLGLEEMTSLIVSQTVSSEAENLLPGEEIPSTKTAQLEILGHDIAETSQVITMSSTGDFVKDKAPEEKKGQPSLEEMTSLIVSQTVSGEVEEQLPGQEKPSTKTAQPDIMSRDVAETTQVITLNGFEEFTEDQPVQQKSKPGFAELTSITISQVVSSEAETDMPTAEQPTTKTAEAEIFGHDIAETSQIVALSNTSDFVDEQTPEGKKGQPTLEEMTSLIISQTISGEFEEVLPGQEKPTTKTAQSDIIGRDIAQTTQVITMNNFGEFTEDKVVTEMSKSSFEELTSLTVSQVVSSEAEKEMPSAEKPTSNIAQSDILGHDIAETTQVVTMSSTGEFVEDKAPEQKKGQPSLEEMTSLIVSQTVSGESEQQLPGHEQPSSKTAQPDISGRDVAEISQVITLNGFGEFTEVKPEEQRGKPGLEEHSSVNVSQVVSNEVEEVLPSPEVPKEKKAEPNLSGREIAESIEVTTHLTTDDFSAPQAPEGQKGKPGLDEMVSVIVSQTISNESENILPIQAPSEVTAQPNLLGRETAETMQMTTVSHVQELVSETTPEGQRVKSRLDEFSSLIVSTALSNEAEVALPSPEVPTGKTAQPSLFGREVAETSQVLTMTSAQDLASSKLPETAQGMPGVDGLTSAIVSQVLSNEIEEQLPGREVPNEKTAQPQMTGRDIAMTSQTITLSSTEEFVSSMKPEEQEGIPNVEEFKSVTVSQVISNEFGEKLPSAEIPSEGLAKSSLSGREAAETIQVTTVSNTEELVKEKAPEGQAVRPIVDELASLTISQVDTNEAEKSLPEDEKPKKYQAMKQMDSIEVAETTEVITVTTTEKLQEHAVPEEQRGRPNLEELVSLSISEVTQGETEDILPSPDVPNKQLADSSLISRPVAEKSQVLATTTTEELLSAPKPEGKKAVSKRIPFETFEQTIQQTHEAESTLTISKTATSAHAEVSIKTSKSVEVTQVVATEKEAKEVIKGMASEVNAQPDIMESQVAVTSEVLPKSTVSEFDVAKPDMKTARKVDEENRSVIVTDFETLEEMESEFPESVKPFSKSATVTYESEHLEPYVGKYLYSFSRSV